MSILIKNAHIYGRKETSLLIDSNKIAELGVYKKDDHVIDANKNIVIPGLVNAHAHLGTSLLRGYADDLRLKPWLEKKIWPAEARMRTQDLVLATSLACLEMIKAGITSFADMYISHSIKIPKTILKSGLRGLLSYGMVDLKKSTKSELSNAKKYIKGIKSLKSSRIVPSLGPHAPHTCSKSLLKSTHDLAKKEGLKIQIHASEGREEVYTIKKKTGHTPIRYLHNLGLLGKNTILAHGIWLMSKDTYLLKETNVIHCPTSNLKLASGLAPIKELLDLNINVALGSDGCASNNIIDIFQEAKLAALLQKYRTWDPTILPAHLAFRLATLNGAKALGFDAGKIQEGKLADLIIIKKRRPHLIPSYDLDSTLIYCTRASDVDTVICDGNILMQNQKVKTLNENKILDKIKLFI